MDLYDEIENWYQAHISNAEDGTEKSGMAAFLMAYVKQVEVLLSLI